MGVLYGLGAVFHAPHVHKHMYRQHTLTRAQVFPNAPSSNSVLHCHCAHSMVQLLCMLHRFPGPDGAYDALHECVGADLLADAIVYVATNESTKNQAFNCSNGDLYRWSEVSTCEGLRSWLKVNRM